jgi:hypothetical protein
LSSPENSTSTPFVTAEASYGSRAETPADLKAALDQALKSLASGKSAIINMIMPAKVR